MGFRIMQLQYEAQEEKANIVDGYEMWLSNSLFRRNNFGMGGDGIIISSSYTPEEKRTVTSVHGYQVKDLGDGFKEIILAISDLAKVEEEQAIFLMIDTGARSIKTARFNSRIAGRFEVGVFILEPNEKIAVTRGGLTEEFVALQFEKRMYLVKIHD